MKTWLITGCSSGLGRGIAMAALKRGEKVAVTARDVKKLREFTKKYPKQVLTFKLDLQDKKSMEQAVWDTYECFGNIDVLVNNAGHGYRAAVEESEPEKIRELFETNFFAPAELIQMVLPFMRSKKSGFIVNVTSIGAVRGALGNGYYSAAKGAMELLTEALEKETAHLGIRTMLVEPGAFRTHFYDDSLRQADTKISDYDVIADRYRKDCMESRHDQPGDPEKGGEIIVDTVLGDNPPLRLLLGSDAVKAAEEVLKQRWEEVENWKHVSQKSDYDV